MMVSRELTSGKDGAKPRLHRFDPKTLKFEGNLAVPKIEIISLSNFLESQLRSASSLPEKSIGMSPTFHES